MDCSAEEQLVRLALDEVDGVDEVQIHLDEREVIIAHSTDRGDLDRAMEGLGLGAAHLGDDDGEVAGQSAENERPALVFALAINAAFFVGEVVFGLLSRSMAVVADGLDMGADAAVYAISLLAVGTTAGHKRRYARASGYAQLLLAFVGLAEVVRRFAGSPDAPASSTMALITVLALLGNVAVLVVLRRVRTGELHLEASWIFTANDVIVNLLVLAAAAAVAFFDSAVPDLVAGAAIFAVVLSGAWRILRMSRTGR